jgi:hypothetical protein
MEKELIYEFNYEISRNLSEIKNKLRWIKNSIENIEKKLNSLPKETIEQSIWSMKEIIPDIRIGSFEEFGKTPREIDEAIEKLMLIYRIINNIIEQSKEKTTK